MQKHVIDSDLYIDLIHSGHYLSEIELLYERETPGIYFSSVVAEELLAGVHTPGMKKLVYELINPFEKAKRMLVPSHDNWKTTGDILARLFLKYPRFKRKLAALTNDCLLAASARSNGVFVHTRNRSDFLLIQSLHPFSLIIHE
jgi:predicted nucleic acid-binding protein